MILINKMLLINMVLLIIVIISFITLKGNYGNYPYPIIIATVTVVGIVLNRKYTWKPPIWYYVLIVLVILFVFLLPETLT